MKSAVFLAVLLWAGIGLARSDGLCTPNHLDYLDEYLIEKVNTQDVEPNVAMMQFYAHELKNTFNPLKMLARSSISKFAEDMKQACSIYDSPKCDFSEFELFNQTFVDLYGGPLRTDTRTSCQTRIKFVYKQMISKYVSQCGDNHRQQVIDSYAEIDPVSRSKVEHLVDKYLSFSRAETAIQSFYKPTDVAEDVWSVLNILRKYCLWLPWEIKAFTETILELTDPGVLELIGDDETDIGLEREGRMLDIALLDDCRQVTEVLGWRAEAAAMDLLFQDPRSTDKGDNLHKILCAHHLCKITLRKRDTWAKYFAYQ